MIWKKLGLIIPTELLNLDWCKNGLLTPTPVLLNKNIIRVFAGFRDSEGISRIGYIDVSAKDPSQVISYSKNPVLDIGKEGCFDDSGLILGDVIKIKNKYHMYYVGFQIPQKAKFLAFTGLATSLNLKNFKKTNPTPILDRHDKGLFINALHSLIKYKNRYIAYVACGAGWEKIRGSFYPQYEIYSTETKDGVNFSKKYKLVIPNNKNNKEYRIGRPSAFLYKNKYRMFFTKGTTSGADYFPGYAESGKDLRKWKRNDSAFKLKLGPDHFDDQHLCYPRFISTSYGTYIFYNGNNMGLEGIAAARLVDEHAN